jgi:hypothetical protein
MVKKYSVSCLYFMIFIIGFQRNIYCSSLPYFQGLSLCLLWLMYVTRDGCAVTWFYTDTLVRATVYVIKQIIHNQI